jgi:hypothetical protein
MFGIDAFPKLLDKLQKESKVENNGKVRSSGHVPWLLTLKRVEGRVGVLGWD